MQLLVVVLGTGILLQRSIEPCTATDELADDIQKRKAEARKWIDDWRSKKN